MEVFKMKKLLLICSLLCTFALVGCSSKPNVKDVPVNDIKESILSKNLIDIPQLAVISLGVGSVVALIVASSNNLPNLIA
jgi:uncharacterized protein YcfL